MNAMSDSHLSNFNLNLLKALDALLREQNVSKAGARIGITQSAMSLALKQLRDIYRDDLLIRGQQSKMTLTAFAKTLVEPVRQALYFSKAAFTAHMPFDPKSTTRTFHIGMSDYIALVLLPKLMQTITQITDHIKIVQHPVNYLEGTKQFDDNALDVVIGDFPLALSTLKTTGLFVDKGVIVADKNNKAMKGTLTLKKFLQYPQVFVSLESHPEENFIVDMLQEQGCNVDVRLITPHTLIALQTLPGTDLMTNTVERLAKPFLEPLGLISRPTPYKLRNYHANLYWHARDHNEPGHRWLRELVKEIAKMV